MAPQRSTKPAQTSSTIQKKQQVDTSKHTEAEPQQKPDFPELQQGKALQSARLNPNALTPKQVLQLQRTVGNQAAARLLSSKLQRRPEGGKATHAHDGKGQSPTPGLRVTDPHNNRSAMRMLIQRQYATLNAMAKTRVDQQSEEKYAAKAQEFEFKMSPKIMSDDQVNNIVDMLLGRVRTIVDAWANATGRELGATYEREFGWKGGDEYYGAFEMTAANIKQVFDDRSQPMRTKLKIVYNAVRNNNLAKWLKVAALELDQKIKGKTPQDLKIKTATQSVVGKDNKIIKGRAEKETVKAGFAEESGLSTILTPQQIAGFATTAQSEKQTEHSRSKRDVFGHDRFSGLAGWKPETSKANKERSGFASAGLSLEEQRTLAVGDVPDLTDAEIDLIYQRQGKPKPDAGERLRFRSNPAAKINWSQGGEFYNINLGSDSAKAAEEVKARMEAGISGSTDLMLHAMQNLGFSDSPEIMKGMRLGLAGWMMANRDHSFYEVYRAAESYGVPFEIDKADPGKEYESAENLYPMQPAKFADTLPEAKFPRYFLSVAYKDTLAGGLGEAGKDEDQFKAALRAQGISDTILATLDKRDTAELSRLSEVVAAQAIDTGERMAKKLQAVRRIKLHRSFIYLGNKLGEDQAMGLLMALMKKHHGGKGLLPVKDDAVATLADAGIPRVMLVGLPKKEIDALEAVRQAVRQAPINRLTGALDMTAVNKALTKLTIISQEKRSVIKAVLIQTYHGNAKLSEDQRYQADAARMLAGHEESGAKKLATAQLDALQAPTPEGGTKITDKNYWEAATARGKLTSNLSILATSYLKKMKPDEKDRIRNLIFNQIGNNDDQFKSDFRDVERDEGFDIAVTSFTPPDFIENHVLPPEAKEGLTGLKNLHDKELGAIFQYTTALYKPLVNASNSFSTKEFKQGDLLNKEWGSPLATLKYTGPMLQAISSGLTKLPLYTGKVYRLDSTSTPLLTMSLKERQRYAARYKVGSIQTQNYPMSTAKSLDSQFAKTNYNNPAFSVVFEIENIKTGHDIQFVSDKVNEEEVLFAPGSRLQVISVSPHNPDDPGDKHIWVKLQEV